MEDPVPKNPACKNCKKPPTLFYKEMDAKNVRSVSSCKECPHKESLQMSPKVSRLCSTCLTSLEKIEKKREAGCLECYEVFKDVIATYLPGEAMSEFDEILDSKELILLMKALQKAVQEELYEEAASIRDKIRMATTQGDPHENSSMH